MSRSLILGFFATLLLAVSAVVAMAPGQHKDLQSFISSVFGFSALVCAGEAWIQHGVVQGSKAGLEAQEKIRSMIRAAKTRIRLNTGTLNYEVYGDLLPDLEAAVRRGVRIQIAVNKLDQRMSLGLRSLLCHAGVEVVDCSRKPFPHGMLIDDSQLRIEEFHPSNIHLDYERKNIFIRSPGLAGLIFSSRFDDAIRGGRLLCQDDLPSEAEASPNA